MPRKGKVPGMAATTSYAIPHCSYHMEQKMQKNDVGQWFCPTCADEWLQEFVSAKTRDHSKGGVILPWGAEDERRKTPSFRDAMPNREARRRARRRHA